MTATANKGTLEFINVVKDYGTGQPAVKGISFRVEDGQLVTLLGPSGCGKTTTLRMIAGLELPTSGQILLGGRDVTAESAAARNVSLVFQSYALFPHLTVMENVCYGPTVQGMKKSDAIDRADAVLRLIGLTGYESRLPSELSGGQQQRVAIARALVLEPAVLLFDEPLSNLDTKLRRHVREEIRELQQRLGITCVYVTHDREEAMAVSDQIIVMEQGRIAEQGTPGALFFSPATAFVADFLSEANVLDIERVAAADVPPGQCRVRLADCVFDVEAPVRAEARRLALRPEIFRIDRDASAAGQVGLPVTISKSAFIGKGVEAEVALADGRNLFVFLSGERQPLVTGQAMTLVFSPSDARLIV
jgi:iron(III) transport system ATP-binding protein